VVDIKDLLGDVIARRGASGTWDELGPAGRARMLAYVERARLSRSRRHRAEEMAFWLSFGTAGADHWLAGRTARTIDYGHWLPAAASGSAEDGTAVA
jgi:hypothetical protein